MHPRVLSVVGSVAVAIGAATLLVPPADAAHRPTIATTRSEASQAGPHSAAASPCYIQGSTNGIGIVSQNFEAEFDDFDSRGADDFLLHSTCVVRKATVKGEYFNGSGPADSVNVILYADAGGHPGAIVRQFGNRDYSDPSGVGNFSVVLPKTVLQPGLYWFAVRVNMNFTADGEWAWLTNYNLHNNVPVWRNPGDGFDTGCITYTKVYNCGFDDEDGGDSLSFTVG